MSEFAPEITVVTKADGQIRIRNLMQLLPESFQLNKDEQAAVAALEAADVTDDAAEVEEVPAAEPVEEAAEPAAEEAETEEKAE